MTIRIFSQRRAGKLECDRYAIKKYESAVFFGGYAKMWYVELYSSYPFFYLNGLAFLLISLSSTISIDYFFKFHFFFLQCYDMFVFNVLLAELAMYKLLKHSRAQTLYS